MIITNNFSYNNTIFEKVKSQKKTLLLIKKTFQHHLANIENVEKLSIYRNLNHDHQITEIKAKFYPIPVQTR